MIVEAVPEGEWDWAVWASDGSGTPCHGSAPTCAAAMAQAEQNVVADGVNSGETLRSAAAAALRSGLRVPTSRMSRNPPAA